MIYRGVDFFDVLAFTDDLLGSRCLRGWGVDIEAFFNSISRIRFERRGGVAARAIAGSPNELAACYAKNMNKRNKIFNTIN